MKTFFKLIRLSLCVGTCAALAGCLTSTPVWDAHFGDAVRQVTAMQTLNPQESGNQDPVAGIDGKSAAAAMGNYDKSFQSGKTDQNAYVIGVGSSK